MLTERSSPRLRGRGRRRVPEGEDAAPEEEEEKEAVPQPPPSDDTRVENMDISDEGEGALLAEGGRAGKGRGPKGMIRTGTSCSVHQRRAGHRLGPQSCWRRTRRSWSCRSSWRRAAGCGSCSNCTSCETAARR